MDENKDKVTQETENKAIKEVVGKFGKQKTYNYEEKVKNKETGKVDTKVHPFVFNYPGTRKASKIIQLSNGEFDITDNTSFYEALMNEDVIVSPKLSWEYWDKKLKKDDKQTSITLVDSNKYKIKYLIDFPGYKIAQKLIDIRGNRRGQAQMDDLYDSIFALGIIKVDGEPDTKVDWDYFDSHEGLLQIMMTTIGLVEDDLNKNGFSEVMEEANSFLTELFFK